MGSEYVRPSVSNEAEKFEWRKFLFLGFTFFFVIGAYTFTKELKDSIFAFIVGREYIPYAKFFAMIGLVPAILFYSKLVDKLRRYYLLVFYTSLYAILSLVFAYYLGHPTIGLANTDSSPYRIFGWIFYFFVEGYSPFIVSVFWAFANSVNSPEAAKKRYGYMVSFSKLGGMITAGLAWMLLCCPDSSGRLFFSDIVSHQLLLLSSAVLLCCVPVTIYFLMRSVPGRFLHGYEAVYKVEKAESKKGERRTGVLSGLKLLLKYPYVLGIFGMVFFYEVVQTVLAYLRLGVAQSSSTSISGVSGMLFQIIFLTHFVGFFISLFGTATLLKKLGERVCLMLVPVISGALLIFFVLSNQNPYALIAAYVVLKSVNYAFSWPVRESLYIPTIKEIKFKSKSWIDAFGSKFAKTSGGVFNLFAAGVAPALFLTVHSVFFVSLIGLWYLTAYLLGRRFERAVENNEVIGVD